MRALFSASENGVGNDGAVALGAALGPKQNPDGTWVLNTALSTLFLKGAALAPLIAPHKALNMWKKCITLIA